MTIEHAVATQDGRALGFAWGCLLTACLELPRHEHGRFALASYALALGVCLPMGLAQFAYAVGMPHNVAGAGILQDAMAAGRAQGVYFRLVELRAIPAQLILCALLGAAHLRMAWMLVDRNWEGAFRTGALTVAATMTLLIFRAILFFDLAPVLLDAVVLALELFAVALAARWQSDLYHEPHPLALRH